MYMCNNTCMHMYTCALHLSAIINQSYAYMYIYIIVHACALVHLYLYICTCTFVPLYNDISVRYFIYTHVRVDYCTCMVYSAYTRWRLCVRNAPTAHSVQ